NNTVNSRSVLSFTLNPSGYGFPSHSLLDSLSKDCFPPPLHFLKFTSFTLLLAPVLFPLTLKPPQQSVFFRHNILYYYGPITTFFLFFFLEKRTSYYLNFIGSLRQ